MGVLLGWKGCEMGTCGAVERAETGAEPLLMRLKVRRRENKARRNKKDREKKGQHVEEKKSDFRLLVELILRLIA